jgi:ABC-type transport system involved in cytochrome c biogenesis permease subunit
MATDPVAPLAAGICFLLAAGMLLAGPTLAREWRIGVWLGAAGAAILSGALIARGMRAAHWPLASEYEFALAFALATALATRVLSARHGENTGHIQAVAMILAAALVAYARLGLPDHRRAIRPLPPALDSVWLPLHVSTAALAYGALALAGAAALIWLVRESERLAAERLLHRSFAAGYPLLTLSMIFGMIWAQVAWGRYWGWDLKEVWTLIIWLICTLYWHLHRRPYWQGRRVAWLALIELAAVLFTFLGVGWLARSVGLASLHLF